MLLCSCSSAGPCGVAASQRVKAGMFFSICFLNPYSPVTIMKCLGRGGRFIAKTGIFAACAAFTFSEILRILRFPWSEWPVDVVFLIKELRILRHDRIPDFLSESLVLGLM